MPDDSIDDLMPPVDASDEFRERARAELSAMWRGGPALAAEPPGRTGAGDRRGWFVLGAAAALVVLVLTGVTLIRGGDGGTGVVSAPPTVAATTNSQTTRTEPTAPGSTVPGSTVPGSTTPTSTVPTTPVPTTTPVTTTPSTSPSSSDAATTTTAAVAPGESISVSFSNPPPLVEPLRVATLETATDSAFVGLGDGIAVVGVPGYWAADGIDRLLVVDIADGSVDELPVDRVPTGLVVGPAAVVYGEILDETRATFVAIALAGERAGETVWSAPSPGHAAEPFDNILAHGPDGIIDRWNDDTLVTPYRDELGSPISAGGPWQVVPLTEVDDGSVIRSSAGASWELGIVRAPTAPASMPNVVAAGPAGSAVVATWIGPRIGDDPDYGTPTVPVVAVLRPDGSGSWYRLPDGWTVVDSNRWGTLVARTTETGFELGLLDPLLLDGS